MRVIYLGIARLSKVFGDPCGFVVDPGIERPIEQEVYLKLPDGFERTSDGFGYGFLLHTLSSRVVSPVVRESDYDSLKDLVRARDLRRDQIQGIGPVHAVVLAGAPGVAAMIGSTMFYDHLGFVRAISMEDAE